MDGSTEVTGCERDSVRAGIVYAAGRIIERSVDPSITAEARKILRLAQTLESHHPYTPG
ncbi:MULTISPECIES: hypothetical protein [Nocardia]|uniref:hypothetical protein n=1 Tax=Nocardia TaxID=1817 RepID=UPI0013003289|nr:MULTISPECIES: hypothetical protein [Nocardia]